MNYRLIHKNINEHLELVAEWNDVSLTPGYSSSFRCYKPGIIETFPRGITTSDGIKKFMDKRMKFLIECGLWNKPHVEIKNYSDVPAVIDREARILFGVLLEKESKRGPLKGYIGFNASPHIRIIIYTGGIFHRGQIPVITVNQRDDAVTRALEILHGRETEGPIEKILHRLRDKARSFIVPEVPVVPEQNNHNLEMEVSRLFDFISSINWTKVGSELDLNQIKEDDPFFPVYMSMYLVKQDFDAVLKSRNEIEKKLEIKRQITNLRADILTLSARPDITESEIISHILETTGNTLKSGRIIFCKVTEDGFSICLEEWREKTRSQVIGKVYGAEIVQILEEHKCNINNPEIIMNEGEKLSEWSEFRNANGFYTAVIIPIYIEKSMYGWFSFEDCHTLFGERFFQDVAGIATEAAGITQNFIEQDLARRQIEESNAELETRVMERTSELSLTNAALKAAINEVRNASEFKSRFLANMSHEMRTPLNGIIGFSEIIENCNSAEQAGDYGKIIKKESNRLLKLINQLLDLSRIEAGKMELDLLDFSLRDIIDSLKKTFGVLAGKKNLEFKVIYNNDIPDYLIGDGMKLHQVLVNLIGNAVKFTNEGSVTLEVRVIEIFKNSMNIMFRVIDTGIGMADDVKARIFEDFVQGDSSITRQYGGSGLGISLSRRFIELMNGELEFNSNPGEGTEFWFVLAFVVSEKTAGASGRFNPIDASEISLTGIRILCAEDYVTNQQVIKHLVEKYKGILTLCNNGREAVELATVNQFDVVLMDIQMPIMDGYTATSIIRRHFDKRQLPIIGITANAFQKDVDECLKAGMNDVLTKPFTSSSFYRKIVDVIASVSDGYCRVDSGTSNEMDDSTSLDKLPSGGLEQSSMDIVNKSMAYLNAEPAAGDQLENEAYHLDIEEFYEKMGGNKAVGLNIIKGFIDRLGEQFDSMEKSFSQSDFVALGQTAHAIKGGALTLCALPLSEAARKIEDCVKNSSEIQIEMLSELEMKITGLRNWFANYTVNNIHDC